MTKIEIAVNKKMPKILNEDCPSDYGMQNKENCTFRRCGVINEKECIECWLTELEEKEDDN